MRGDIRAKIRWELYRRYGYWTIIPGDTMNLLGGGFACPALYGVTNSRLPKGENGFRAPDVFAEALDRAALFTAEGDRPALEKFRSFAVNMGECVQKELVESGLASLSGASFQNLLHAAVMVHAGAYREGIPAVDEDRYRVGTAFLERALNCAPRGTVIPMSFDKVTLVTKHAGGRTVVGGINRVLLAKGAGENGLEYGELVPNAMLAGAPEESEEREREKLAGARVVDWYAAEVEHGPISETFNNDWVFQEVRPVRPRPNPQVIRALRALKRGGTVVIPPGNAHESTYTFFLLDGILEELQAARARGVRVMLVCNPVNLLFSAGYTVSDYLHSVEMALGHTSGRPVRIEEVLDRVVVNDASQVSEGVQRMMQGEGIPPEVKRELLHRTPTGPVTISPEERASLEARGLEVMGKPMLEVQTVSIRGLETDTISYHRDLLAEALQ